MGILNRVFSFLIFILAIGAAVGAFFLSEKRTELLNSKKELAQAVNTVAGALDTNSGTNYKGKLDPDDMKNVATIQDAAKKAAKQAKEIIAQRDELSNRLKDISTTLNIPNFRETDFQNVEEYSDKGQTLISEITKVKERSDDIVKAIEKNGSKVGAMVTADQLSGDKYSEALKRYNGKVNFYMKKHGHLVAHAKDVAENLGLNSPKLNTPNYNAMLQTTLEEVKSFKESADQTSADLKSAKNQIARTRKDLERAQEEISSKVAQNDKQKKEIAAKIKEIEKIKKQLEVVLNPTGDSQGVFDKGDGPVAPQFTMFRKLKGKVIKVNRKWGFVVLNLKAKNELDDNGKTIPNVLLPVNQEMIIARGLGEDSQFVGKIKIAKVYDQCSVGNILAEPKALPVQVGDDVYFGEEEKEEEPEEDIEEAEEEKKPAAAAAVTPAAAKKATPAAAEKKEEADDEDADDDKDDDDEDEEEEEDLEEFEEDEEV